MSLAHTTKSQSFAAEIVWDGTKNALRFVSERYLRHHLNTFGVGTKLTVILTDKKPKRTEAQNNYLWGVYYVAIMAETGEDDIEALHELMKGMFLTKEIKEVLGKPVRVTGSTTNLSVSEFSEFVMRIEAFTGIEAPPTENYSLASLRPKLI